MRPRRYRKRDRVFREGSVQQANDLFYYYPRRAHRANTAPAEPAQLGQTTITDDGTGGIAHPDDSGNVTAVRCIILTFRLSSLPMALVCME
ncbi:MAG: hypothetical protein ACOX8W_07425 [bacterium]|jgi:hypothetical protein